jgi:hypothetical protein
MGFASVAELIATLSPWDLYAPFTTTGTTISITTSRIFSQRTFKSLPQTLCAALNGVQLPSFPKHTVAVKYKICLRCHL